MFTGTGRGLLCWSNCDILFPHSSPLTRIFPPPTASAEWGWGEVGVGAEGGRTEAPPSPPPLGYAEPLKGVPPEKFNHTAIPKGYRCPWQEFVSYRDYQSDGRSHTPSPNDYRNFNK